MRLNTPQYAFSSFFLDNWAASLLQVEPGNVFRGLREVLGTPEDVIRADLQRLAGSALRGTARSNHRELFLAFQFAALSLLSEKDGGLGVRAAIALHELFDLSQVPSRPVPMGGWLETTTFFTELRKRSVLCADLWPNEACGESHKAFHKRELRRELLSSMCRLGHSLIDLWIVYINQARQLETRATERAEFDAATLASSFLDLLERQRNQSGFNAWHELHEAARNFDLILNINAPSLWERKLTDITIEFGKLLREQQPVGGMSGAVNQTLVRQFRMPGYPLALITTDLLQEGEDLHLFCSRAYHYGISWMPSSMEQRIGRLDRVLSQTERRITRLEMPPEGNQLLQVFYPYLPDTVEVIQVRRVFERLNRFMRLMHEGFGTSEEDRDRKIDVVFEAQRGHRDIDQLLQPLRSAFPVKPKMISGPKSCLPVDAKSEKEILNRFKRLKNLAGDLDIQWQLDDAPNAFIGTISRLGTVSQPRKQPFTLLLLSIEGMLTVRCVSPVGTVEPRGEAERIAREARGMPVRIGAVFDPRFKRYDLTTEGDVLLGQPASDRARVRWLLQTVLPAADRLEEVLLHEDKDLAYFREDLEKEVDFER